jgi:hypothetical protein
MLGLMIIHAAMGNAVQLRRYHSGTTTRGVEAHLLQALMGWACLMKTQLRIEVDIPYLQGLEGECGNVPSYPDLGDVIVKQMSCSWRRAIRTRYPLCRSPDIVLRLSSTGERVQTGGGWRATRSGWT